MKVPAKQIRAQVPFRALWGCQPGPSLWESGWLSSVTLLSPASFSSFLLPPLPFPSSGRCLLCWLHRPPGMQWWAEPDQAAAQRVQGEADVQERILFKMVQPPSEKNSLEERPQNLGVFNNGQGSEGPPRKNWRSSYPGGGQEGLGWREPSPKRGPWWQGGVRERRAQNVIYRVSVHPALKEVSAKGQSWPGCHSMLWSSPPRPPADKSIWLPLISNWGAGGGLCQTPVSVWGLTSPPHSQLLHFSLHISHFSCCSPGDGFKLSQR